MIFLSIIPCIIFSMLGGQLNKLFRPIGIPISIILIYLLSHNHPWWCCLPALIYAFELTLGYGENSKLAKWLKDDRLVRYFYGMICAIPIVISCILTWNLYFLPSSILPVIAYQLKLGSWGKIGKYDILPDDLFRGLSIGLAMSLALI